MKIVLLIIWLYQACGFACHQSCLTCSGTTQLDCLTCSSGIVSPAGMCSCPPLQVFQEGICQVACSDGYEEQGLYCQKCQTNCRKCLNQVCLSCFNIHQKLNSNICQPYCEPWTYYFEQECLWLINQGEEKNFEILFYAFNEDKNSCEAESIQFTFEPILSSSGNIIYLFIFSIIAHIIMVFLFLEIIIFGIQEKVPYLKQILRIILILFYS